MAVSMVLAGLVVGMLIGGGHAPLALAEPASAPVATRRCEWSYVQDVARPGIGQDGKSELDETWRAMSVGGWHLVFLSGDNYYFERCRLWK